MSSSLNNPNPGMPNVQAINRDAPFAALLCPQTPANRCPNRSVKKGVQRRWKKLDHLVVQNLYKQMSFPFTIDMVFVWMYIYIIYTYHYILYRLGAVECSFINFERSYQRTDLTPQPDVQWFAGPHPRGPTGRPLSRHKCHSVAMFLPGLGKFLSFPNGRIQISRSRFLENSSKNSSNLMQPPKPIILVALVNS